MIPVLHNSRDISKLERRDYDHENQKPMDMVLEIFSFFNAFELPKFSSVSKLWNQLTHDPSLWDLKKLFPKVAVFDESDWKKYFGIDVQEKVQLDLRTAIPSLIKFSSLSIERDAGITRLIMPKEVTLNDLFRVARSPLEGPVTKFYAEEDIAIERRNIAEEESYEVWISNNILRNSRNYTFDEQRELVANSGFEMVPLLTQATLLATTFVQSKTVRLSDDTFTRCTGQMAIGNKLSEGLIIQKSLTNALVDYGISVCYRPVKKSFPPYSPIN